MFEEFRFSRACSATDVKMLVASLAREAEAPISSRHAAENQIVSGRSSHGRFLNILGVSVYRQKLRSCSHISLQGFQIIRNALPYPPGKILGETMGGNFAGKHAFRALTI